MQEITSLLVKPRISKHFSQDPVVNFSFIFFPQNRLTHSLSPWSHPFTCGNSERGLTNDVEIFVAKKEEDQNTFFPPFSWAPSFGDNVLLN